tara:strand:+ start:115 stop:441 length:327 start_codon:yes stop_codon:yes gene_type:complete
MGSLKRQEIEELPLLILKGFTKKEIALKYGCHVSTIVRLLNFIKYKKRIVEVSLGSKKVAYYDDEMMYANIPKYKFSELSKVEKLLHKRRKRRSILVKFIQTNRNKYE